MFRASEKAEALVLHNLHDKTLFSFVAATFKGIQTYGWLFVSMSGEVGLPCHSVTEPVNGLILKMESLNLAADVKSEIEGY